MVHHQITHQPEALITAQYSFVLQPDPPARPKLLPRLLQPTLGSSSFPPEPSIPSDRFLVKWGTQCPNQCPKMGRMGIRSY